MRVQRYLVALLLTVAFLRHSAMAATEPAGAALYRGEGLKAVLPGMGGLRLEGAAAACARCHGVDARGLLEGGLAAPALIWRRLQAPTPARPGYDVTSLHQALTEGHDPAGRQLHPVMPHYILTEQQIGALVTFLKNESSPAPGVTDGEIRLAVPHLVGDEFIPALLDALWAAPGRGAWGRRLRAVGLPVEPSGTGMAAVTGFAALAAVAGPGGVISGLDAALAARGLLHLFPRDEYVASSRDAILAEAPLAVQLAVLRRQAEALGGTVAMPCSTCAVRLPPDATAVLFEAPPTAAELAGVPSGATVFMAFDHAAPVLRERSTWPFPLVLADPRGRAMPAAVFDELRRLAPGLLTRKPELARRLHAAAVLTTQVFQRVGPGPSAAGLRAALNGTAAGDPGALLAPYHDGIRPDGAYGVQLLHLAPGGLEVQANTSWERP